jgi:hypothetical protein
MQEGGYCLLLVQPVGSSERKRVDAVQVAVGPMFDETFNQVHHLWISRLAENGEKTIVHAGPS